MTADEPVASGLSYTVTNIDGHSPSGLDDFTGDVHLTVTKEGESTHLVGVVGGETADGVRFYQKDPGLHDRDIRVWIITESGGSFSGRTIVRFLDLHPSSPETIDLESAVQTVIERTSTVNPTIAVTSAERPASWTALLVDPTNELSQLLPRGMLSSGARRVVLAHSGEKFDEMLGDHHGDLAVVSFRFGADTDLMIKQLRQAGWDRVLLFGPAADITATVSAFHAGATGLLRWPTLYAHIDAPRWVRDLSAREEKVLSLVAAGLSNRQIGDELKLSAAVIKRQVARIGRLVGSGNRCEMVTMALRAGVLPQADDAVHITTWSTAGLDGGFQE